MKTLKYKGESYQACAPRHVVGAGSEYVCDAWKTRTGRVVKNHETLNALGQMLMRGGKWR